MAIIGLALIKSNIEREEDYQQRKSIIADFMRKRKILHDFFQELESRERFERRRRPSTSGPEPRMSAPALKAAF